MADDGPADNLRRILLDGQRIRSGERLVDDRAERGQLPAPVATIAVDLDGSASVRARGIEAKITMVNESRSRMRDCTPDGGLIIDSGTRDETHVVLPASGADRAREVAERLRAAVAGMPFLIFGPDDPVHVTASVGYAVRDRTAPARELFAAARESLHAAKLTGDCVRTARATTAVVPFEVPRSVLMRLDRYRIGVRDAIWTGLRALDEKYGGIWHWAVERTGVLDGRPLPHDVVPGPAGVAAADWTFFALLVRSAVLEAVVAARCSAGERFSIDVVRGHDGVGAAADGTPGLAALYLPGELVVLRPAADSAPRLGPSSAVDLVQAARYRAAGVAVEGTATVDAALLSSQIALVEKVALKHGRRVDSLLAEAVQLAADRAACRASVGSF